MRLHQRQSDCQQRGGLALEFTSRFGYPGYAICELLHKEPWEVIFQRMVAMDSIVMPTLTGFSAGVVLTVPPFPYTQGYEELSKG